MSHMSHTAHTAHTAHTIYSLPRDVLNIIKDLLRPKDYFRVLCVAWLFHDPITELERKLKKTRDMALIYRAMNADLRTRKKKPTRPASAYIWFVRHVRPQFTKKNPNLSFQQTHILLAERWHQMTDAEKTKYETLHTADCQRYNFEIARYNEL